MFYKIKKSKGTRILVPFNRYYEVQELNVNSFYGQPMLAGNILSLYVLYKLGIRISKMKGEKIDENILICVNGDLSLIIDNSSIKYKSLSNFIKDLSSTYTNIDFSTFIFRYIPEGSTFRKDFLKTFICDFEHRRLSQDIRLHFLNPVEDAKFIEYFISDFGKVDVLFSEKDPYQKIETFSERDALLIPKPSYYATQGYFITIPDVVICFRLNTDTNEISDDRESSKVKYLCLTGVENILDDSFFKWVVHRICKYTLDSEDYAYRVNNIASSSLKHLISLSKNCRKHKNIEVQDLFREALEHNMLDLDFVELEIINQMG